MGLYGNSKQMTAKELKSSIDHLKVWNALIGVGSLKTVFRSPFREDPSPGCKLYAKNQEVKFTDKSRNICYDVIDGYRQLNPHVTDWAEICKAILTLSGASLSTEQQIKQGLLRVTPTIIKPIVVHWSEWGLGYWESRGVTEGQLSDPQTLTQEISGYTVQGEDKSGNSYARSYNKRGFVYWVNNKPKLYFPEADKKNKFKGNLSQDDNWVFIRNTSIDLPKTCIFAKSNKDAHVWKSFVNCSIATVSAERVFPSPEWLLTNIRMKFDRVAIVFDPDETGVAGAQEFKSILDGLSDIGQFEVKIWNWPDPISKDLDQFRADNGHYATSRFLWDNGFYNIFD